MKKPTLVIAATALAVLAAPLRFQDAYAAHRSIASQEAVEQVNEDLNKPLNSPQVPVPVAVVKVVKLTVNDPAVIQKFHERIAEEKRIAGELQTELTKTRDELNASTESLKLSLQETEQRKNRAEELEVQLKEQEGRIASLAETVVDLEGRKGLLEGQLEEAQKALAEAQSSAEEARKTLDEVNQKLSEAESAIAKKDEELKAKDAELAARAEALAKKDEELKGKTEELGKKEEELKLKAIALTEKTEEFDTYKCQSQERFVVMTDQLKELNDQQKQFTQVLLGLNQVLLGMFNQMQNMNKQPQVLGMGPAGYFGAAYQPNPYFMGQWPSPSQSFMAQGMNFNPFTQQGQQPQMINNYYYGSQFAPGQGQMQFGSPQFGQGQLQPQPSYFQAPMAGSFNFDSSMVNDAQRPAFGPTAQVMPQMQPMQIPQMLMAN